MTALQEYVIPRHYQLSPIRKRFAVLGMFCVSTMSASDYDFAWCAKTCRKLKMSACLSNLWTTFETHRAWMRKQSPQHLALRLRYILAAEFPVLRYKPLILDDLQPMLLSPFRILRMERHDQRWRASMRFLATTAAGLIATCSLPEHIWLQMAFRFGFRRPHVLEDPSGLIGLYGVGTFDLLQQHYKLAKILLHQSVLRANRRILHLRFRFLFSSARVLCPYAYDHPCEQCERTDSECQASYRVIVD